MFGVDWSNPDTLLLNLTNLGLGILLAVALGWAMIDILIDLFEKWRRAGRAADPAAREVARLRWQRNALR